MTHPARVLACGWFGEGNLGDEAMLEGLIRLLRRTFDKPAITVMTADLEDAQRRFGVSAITTYGKPCVDDMRRANLANMSVTTITAGMPRSSRAGVTWLHHVVHDPQSPLAVITTSQR